MIDVRIGMPPHLLKQEAHQIFEGQLFLGGIVRPERPEGQIASTVQTAIHPEEIFKPLARERIAFHIKIEIAVVGCRKHREAAPARVGQ